MRQAAQFAFLITIISGMAAIDARAAPTTVCTITVNSSNEKDAFRRYLPKAKFEFVELVEPGNRDWLASACRKKVQCDVLVVSGHFGGAQVAATEFYSDQVGSDASLPVEEMERASCSESCPGVFAHLKEVYLFGCETLNSSASRSTADEIARTLVRRGQSPIEAARVATALNESHGESNRDRMRRTFAGVPVIYGFSSIAPLGPIASSILTRHLQSASSSEIGSGQVNQDLLAHFAANSMTVASGLRDADRETPYRNEVCQFYDERLPAARKLAFIHDLIARDVADARMFFERIEMFLAALSDEERQAPSFTQALAELGRDQPARESYMGFARNEDSPPIRARMIEVAYALKWLSPAQRHAEIVRTVNDLLADDRMGFAAVDLMCTLNKNGELDGEFDASAAPARTLGKVEYAAALACLGSDEARARVLIALTSSRDDDVQMAQVYLRHRPITDATEFRGVANEIAQMRHSGGQVRTLDTLAGQGISDPESLNALTRLFPVADSVRVQRAIAGVIIRSDYREFDKLALVQVLRTSRLKSPDGEDVIDVLIRRLQSH